MANAIILFSTSDEVECHPIPDHLRDLPGLKAVQQAMLDDNQEELTLVLAKANCDLIVAAMKSHGLTLISIEYAGGGDEGGVERVEFQPVGTKPEEATVYRLVQHTDYFRKTRNVGLACYDLEEAASQYADDLLEVFGHDGYHNGDGGYGTVTISADGKVTMDHSDYVTTTESTSHVL